MDLKGLFPVSSGVSVFLIFVLLSLPAEPPGPPAGLKVGDSTKTSITLSWSKPVYDGGAPIIGYSLDMRLKSEADPEKPTEGWKRIDTHGPLVLTEFTIGQLDEKQEYEFKVSARNQVGWGRHAYLKEAVFPKEILGKNEQLLQPTVAAVSLSKSKILEEVVINVKITLMISTSMCFFGNRGSRDRPGC